MPNGNEVDMAQQDWRKDSRLAAHWHPADDEARSVVCDLNPRHCKIKPGEFGFCGVRGNVNGKLHTFNYGKSVAPTQELIETEAVNLFSPGSPILSLGNVGCMMHCDFCQNWETSQVKHLDPAVINVFTPSQVVDICERHGIKVISWTYNDPVVWHEFVVETSRLAQKKGIKTLYKSAFYIEEEPLSELIECIDIFSISLKSMDPKFYRKITGARLEPVLERIKQVFRSGKHLEISQLLVTGRNEQEADVQKTIDWMLSELGPNVPLHFVAFHPAYRYMNVSRTPKEALTRARELAIRAGIRHCYIGNVYEDGMADSKCHNCGAVLVQRFGLRSDIVGISEGNHCKECGSLTDVKEPFFGQSSRIDVVNPDRVRSEEYHWSSEVNSVHVELGGNVSTPVRIRTTHKGTGQTEYHKLDGDLRRFNVSRRSNDEGSVVFEWNHNVELTFLPILDRAHFPVVPDVETNLLGITDRADKLHPQRKASNS